MIKTFEFVLTRFSNSPCAGTSNFLGFPNWYRGLNCNTDGSVIFSDLNNVWLVVANVADIAIRLGGLLAVIFLIYGGIRYIISGGEPNAVVAAKNTIMFALIGLVIAILASTIVGFIAGLF